MASPLRLKGYGGQAGVYNPSQKGGLGFKKKRAGWEAESL
jgi:hypothetical protein